MNNLKTGIHAKSLVFPYENLADLRQLVEECYLHYHPANPEQRFYVDDLVRCEWTLHRLDNAETQTWQHQNHDIYRDPEKYPLGKASSSNPNSFSKLQYRLDATRRARDRAILAITCVFQQRRGEGGRHAHLLRSGLHGELADGPRGERFAVMQGVL